MTVVSRCDEALHEIDRLGLLVMQGRRIRSVIGILAGAPISSSWWSHPASHEMYLCLERIGGSPDVLVCRLIAGKVTYLHRRLWPAFLSVALAEDEWQTAGLSRAELT